MRIIKTSQELYEWAIDVFQSCGYFSNAVKFLKENPETTLEDIYRHRKGDTNLRLAIQTILSPHQQIWQPHQERLRFKFDENWKDNMIQIRDFDENWIYLVEFVNKYKVETEKVY